MRLSFAALASVALGLPVLSFACGGGEKTATAPTASASYSAPPSPSAGAPDPIDGALAQLAARVAPGMVPEGPAAKVSLPPGAHSQRPIGLEAGKCYVIVGIGPQGSDVDLVLVAAGQPVAQDAENDATATLGAGPLPLCPQQPMPLSLDVSIKNIGGVVGVQLYSKPAPAPVASASASASTPPAVDPTDALLKSEGAKLAKGMDAEGPPTKGALQEGGKLQAVVTLAPGRCYSIVAVSPPGGVTDFDMVLLMAPFFTVESGKNARSGNVALIGGTAKPLCPLAIIPVPYRIDLTAKKGSGLGAMQVYSRAK